LRVSFLNAESSFADWNIRAVCGRSQIPHRGTVFSRVKNGRVWPGKTDGRKKSPLSSGLESIFLEEDRGDRKHCAALHKNSPMTFGDVRHPPGA
jgi:hypothetical protein